MASLDGTSAATGTILCVDDGKPDLLAMMRLIERTQNEVFDTIALAPKMMAVLEDPRPMTTDILRRHAQAAPMLLGMQVRFNSLLDEMPARVHRKRRNQSWAYHNRIQKKWNKRFGVGPVAVLMNTNFLHPALNTPRTPPA